VQTGINSQAGAAVKGKIGAAGMRHAAGHAAAALPSRPLGFSNPRGFSNV
jgi:hypothetical protein